MKHYELKIDQKVFKTTAPNVRLIGCLTFSCGKPMFPDSVPEQSASRECSECGEKTCSYILKVWEE